MLFVNCSFVAFGELNLVNGNSSFSPHSSLDGIDNLIIQHTIHGKLHDRPCLMFSSIATFRFVGLVEVHVGRFADLHVRQFEK